MVELAQLALKVQIILVPLQAKIKTETERKAKMAELEAKVDRVATELLLL